MSFVDEPLVGGVGRHSVGSGQLGTLNHGIARINIQPGAIGSGQMGSFLLNKAIGTLHSAQIGTIFGAYGSFGSVVGGIVRARYGSFVGTLRGNRVQGLYGSFRGVAGTTTALRTTYGTFAVARLPSLSGGYVGTLAAARIPLLQNQHGTLASPNLGTFCAAKVTYGSLAPSPRIGTIPAGKTTYGTFGASRIPLLQNQHGTLASPNLGTFTAAKTTYGTFGASRVPLLQNQHGTLASPNLGTFSAAKVTYGTFGPARIPASAQGTLSGARSAGSLVRGTIANPRLPRNPSVGSFTTVYLNATGAGSIPASMTKNGTFAVARMPGLGGAYVGTLAAARLPLLQNQHGTLASPNLGTFSAAKVTYGSIAPSPRIGTIPAGKTTYGTFGASRIPLLQNLHGTLASPNLGTFSAAKVTYGTFVASRIPLLQNLAGTIQTAHIGRSAVGSGQMGSFLLNKAIGTLHSAQIGTIFGAYGSFGSVVGGIVRARYGSFVGTLRGNRVQGLYGSFSGVAGTTTAARTTYGTFAVARLPSLSGAYVGTLANARLPRNPSVGSFTTVYLNATGAGSIPASMTKNGTFAVARMPGLGGAYVGTLSVARLPSLGGAYVGTLAAARLPTLQNQHGTLASPNLGTFSAAKVTYGSLAPSPRIGTIPAGKTTYGTFAVARIPQLQSLTGTLLSLHLGTFGATKLAYGTLATARLPATSQGSLVGARNAGSLVRGTMQSPRLGTHSAAKITYGSLAPSPRIGTIPAGKTTYGTFTWFRHKIGSIDRFAAGKPVVAMGIHPVTMYMAIGTLLPSGTPNFAKMEIEIGGGQWGASDLNRHLIILGNSGTFRANYAKMGSSASSFISIQAYGNRHAGTVKVYAQVKANSNVAGMIRARLNQTAYNNLPYVTLPLGSPTGMALPPAGTLLWDSGTATPSMYAGFGSVDARIGSFRVSVVAPTVRGKVGSFARHAGSIAASFTTHGTFSVARLPALSGAYVGTLAVGQLPALSGAYVGTLANARLPRNASLGTVKASSGSYASPFIAHYGTFVRTTLPAGSPLQPGRGWRTVNWAFKLNPATVLSCGVVVTQVRAPTTGLLGFSGTVAEVLEPAGVTAGFIETVTTLISPYGGSYRYRNIGGTAAQFQFAVEWSH